RVSNRVGNRVGCAWPRWRRGRSMQVVMPLDVLLPVLILTSLVLQFRGRGHLRLRMRFNWTYVVAAAAVAVVASAPNTPGPVANAQTATATSAEVHITDAGFQPASLSLVSGGSVHWT